MKPEEALRQKLLNDLRALYKPTDMDGVEAEAQTLEMSNTQLKSYVDLLKLDIHWGSAKILIFRITGVSGQARLPDAVKALQIADNRKRQGAYSLD